VLDRAINYEMDIYDALKVGLISIDSTMWSNLSVGMPIDLMVLRRDTCGSASATAIAWSSSSCIDDVVDACIGPRVGEHHQAFPDQNSTAIGHRFSRPCLRLV
jgi:hypothetical protein